MSPKIAKILFLLILPFVLYKYVWVPLYSGEGALWKQETSLKDLKELGVEYDSALVQAEALTNLADTSYKEYQQVDEETKNRASIIIPETAERITLASEITSIVKIAGFPAGPISLSDVSVPVEGRHSINFSFSGKGSYFGFKQIVKALESSLRVYTITGFNFKAPLKEAKEQSYVFRINGITYQLKKI